MRVRTVSNAVLVGLFSFSVHAAAQDTGPATTVAPTPVDYGSAFSVFYKLGLPRIPEGAEYVELQAYSPFRQYQQSIMDRIGMRQRAWMLPGEGDRRTFIMMSGESMDVYDQKALQKLMMKKAKENAENGDPDEAMFMDGTYEGAVSGSWKIMDQAKDAQKLVDALAGKGKTESGQPIEKDLSRYFGRNYMSAGPVLLAAVQYYGCGLTNEANQIAASAFTLAKDKRKVLVQAMVTLAESQYQTALGSFGRSGDWQALHDELAVIHTRFKAAWEKTPGLELLMKKVAARIGQAVPTVDDASLSDADRKLVASLTDLRISGKRPRRFLYGGGLQVVLNPSIQKQLLMKSEDDPLTQLLARGIHAIPVLLALLEDEYLIPMMARDLQQMGVHSSFVSFSRSYGGNMNAQKTPEQVYAEMQHPLSRGDLSKALLMPLLPVSNEMMYGGETASPEEFADTARTFYSENGNKSPFDLAKVYLTGGNQQQRMQAGQVMMQSKSPKVAAALKEYFLADGEDHEVSSKAQYLIQYATINPAAAKPIAIEMKKKLDEALKAQLAQYGNDKNTRKLLEQQFKSLEQQFDAIAGGKEVSLDTALSEITADPHSMTQVHTLLQKEDPTKALAAILTHAVASDNPTNRVMLVSLGQMLSYRSNRNMGNPFMLGQEFDEELFFDEQYAESIAKAVAQSKVTTASSNDVASVVSDANKSALKLSDFREQWKTLLADDRSGMPTAMSRMYGAYGGMQSQTVGDVTASTIVTMGMQGAAAGHGYAGYHQEMAVLGDQLFPLIQETARAILDGKTGDDLPQMPSADNVTPKAVSNLVKRLSNLPVAEAVEATQKLSLDEKLALHTALNDAPDLNSKLAEKAHCITEVELGKLTTLGASLNECKGAVLSSNVVRTLLEVTETAAKQGKRVLCNAVRRPWFEGISIQLTSLDDLEEGNPYAQYSNHMGLDPFGGGMGTPRATVQGTVQSSGAYGSAVWTVEAPATKGKDKAENSAAQAFLSQLGVEAASKMTPEMMSQLMSQMGDMNEGMSEHYETQKNKFWESVQKFCSASNNVCVHAQVMFYSNVPKDDDEQEVMVIE